MRRVVSVLVWWPLLVCLWALYVGTTTWIEIVTGLGAAAIATIAAEVVRSHGLLSFRADRSWLGRALKVPPLLVFEFGVVSWVLVASLARGRRVAGELVTAPLDGGGDSDVGRWRRAFATTLTSMTPNAIVVEAEEGSVLLHTLSTSVWQGDRPV